MTHTTLLKRINQRKSVVNLDVNMKIKQLQKRLVTISFMEGNHSADYFSVLGKIKELRKHLF